jgi:hypothetical protein
VAVTIKTGELDFFSVHCVLCIMCQVAITHTCHLTMTPHCAGIVESRSSSTYRTSICLGTMSSTGLGNGTNCATGSACFTDCLKHHRAAVVFWDRQGDSPPHQKQKPRVSQVNDQLKRNVWVSECLSFVLAFHLQVRLRPRSERRRFGPAIAPLNTKGGEMRQVAARTLRHARQGASGKCKLRRRRRATE